MAEGGHDLSHREWHCPTRLAMPAAAVLFVLPLAYWPTFFEAASIPRFLLIDFLAFAGWGSLVWREKTFSMRWHPAGWLILTLASWSAISLTWTPDTGDARIALSQSIPALVLGLLGLQMADERILDRWLLPALLAGSGIAALIGIGQYFGYNPLGFRHVPGRIPSTFINRNHAANYFDFMIPLAFFATLYYKKANQHRIAALVLGLSITFVVLNGSRGSVLALVIGCMVLIFVCIRHRQLRQSLVSFLVARRMSLFLAILVPLVVISTSHLVPEETHQQVWNTGLLHGKLDPSSQYRLAIYINSLPVLFDNPLTGTGIGGIRTGMLPYINAFMPLSFRTEDVALHELHNDYLQYLIELGIPGGLLFLAILGVTLRFGLVKIVPVQPASRQWLQYAFGFALLASATHSLVDFPQHLPTSASLFWLFAGIVLGLSPQSRQWTPVRQKTGLVRLTLGIASIGFLAIFLFFHIRQLLGNHALYEASLYLQKGQCVPAAKASKRGLATFPEDFILRTIHAQIYTACSFPPEQKLAEMNRLLLADPTNLRARLTRANLYNLAGRPDLAIPEFRIVAQSLPHRPTAYAGMGDAMRLLGKKARARRLYSAALKRKPDYLYVINRLKQLDADTEIP